MVERSRYLQVALDTAEELVNGPAQASMVDACNWLGMPRSTMYRLRSPKPTDGVVTPQRDRAYRHRLSDAERRQVVARLNQADVEEMSIRQAFHHFVRQQQMRGQATAQLGPGLCAVFQQLRL